MQKKTLGGQSHWQELKVPSSPGEMNHEPVLLIIKLASKKRAGVCYSPSSVPLGDSAGVSWHKWDLEVAEETYTVIDAN